MSLAGKGAALLAGGDTGGATAAALGAGHKLKSKPGDFMSF